MEKSACVILLFVLSGARYSLQLDCADMKGFNQVQQWNEDFVVEWIEAMIACGNDMDSNQIIQLVVQRGFLKVVKILLESGADVNATEANSGRTVLMVAVIHGYKDIAALLIEKGANINAFDKDGRTALIYMAMYGRKEIVPFLST